MNFVFFFHSNRSTEDYIVDDNFLNGDDEYYSCPRYNTDGTESVSSLSSFGSAWYTSASQLATKFEKPVELIVEVINIILFLLLFVFV